jgi:formylmethanofuran dehydrogenase subunit E
MNKTTDSAETAPLSACPGSHGKETWCRDSRGQGYTFQESLDFIRSFHGHVAPGLVIGLKMVDWAREKIPEGVLFDAVCETTSCLPDAVQMLTPCTVGNSWLKTLNLGRFALTLYDKFTGGGHRVSIDPCRLKRWPEFYDWFFKRKAKNDQNFNRLIEEIRRAGTNCLIRVPVTVQPSLRMKKNKGAIATCSKCGEAYPRRHGRICRACRGDAVYIQGREVAAGTRDVGSCRSIKPRATPTDS